MAMLVLRAMKPQAVAGCIQATESSSWIVPVICFFKVKRKVLEASRHFPAAGGL